MTEGYHVKDYGQPIKRYVQTMDLKDDPELIYVLSILIIKK